MLLVLTETYCNKLNIQIIQRDDFIQTSALPCLQNSAPFTVSGAIWIYSASSHLISQPRLCLPCYLLFSGFLSRILSAFPGVRFVGHNFKENTEKLTKLNKSWQWRWRRKTIFFTLLSKPGRFNIAARLSKYSRETQGSNLSRITIYSQWSLAKLCLVSEREGTLRTFNPLALELDIYSLAHHLCKMWIFYERKRVTLGNTRHFVEE